MKSPISVGKDGQPFLGGSFTKIYEQPVRRGMAVSEKDWSATRIEPPLTLHVLIPCKPYQAWLSLPRLSKSARSASILNPVGSRTRLRLPFRKVLRFCLLLLAMCFCTTAKCARRADVKFLPDGGHQASALAGSEWFERGWTLQELLASTSLAFYSPNWSLIGDRGAFLDQIERRTGIGRQFLTFLD